MNVKNSTISWDSVFVQALLSSKLYFLCSALVFKETKTLGVTTLNTISIEQKDFQVYSGSHSSSVRNAVFAMLINFHKAFAHSALDILNTLLFCRKLISKLLNDCAVSNRSLTSFYCTIITERNYYLVVNQD